MQTLKTTGFISEHPRHGLPRPSTSNRTTSWCTSCSRTTLRPGWEPKEIEGRRLAACGTDESCDDASNRGFYVDDGAARCQRFWSGCDEDALKTRSGQVMTSIKTLARTGGFPYQVLFMGAKVRRPA